MRSQSNKEVKSINFDKEVLKTLEIKCKKENINISSFVNHIIRIAVMSEYEYYRQLSKKSASELAKYQTLMDTASDKPRRGGANGEAG